MQTLVLLYFVPVIYRLAYGALKKNHMKSERTCTQARLSNTFTWKNNGFFFLSFSLGTHWTNGSPWCIVNWIFWHRLAPMSASSCKGWSDKEFYHGQSLVIRKKNKLSYLDFYLHWAFRPSQNSHFLSTVSVTQRKIF